MKVSVILPAKNEAGSLSGLVAQLTNLYPESEVLVVDDGSSDNTREICENHSVRVVSNPYSMGNGAAIKRGAKAATGEILVFMDADGQHDPVDVRRLVDKLQEGYDMVVGSRDGSSQANFGRKYANVIYNRLASWIVGHEIADLTSGFRAVRTKKFRKYLYLLPNGFSYPTTITMTFFRSGYSVFYLPVSVAKREGKSHINPIKDGVRFLLIIFKVGTLYSPLKIFFPTSVGLSSVGIAYYAYTYFTTGRFTNMSGLLLISSVIIFFIGLVAEQITSLFYKESE